MARAAWLALALALAAVAAGCDGAADRSARRQVAQGTATVGGNVVSTVAGEPITVGEVRALAGETGLPAEEVLRRLQDRVLLMREAEAKGWHGGAEGSRLARKAAVQALLADRIEALKVPEQDLRAAYEAQKEQRFDVGERRTCVHVLAKVGADAEPALRAQARELAQRAIALLEREPDFDKVRRQVHDWGAGSVVIKAESLPPTPRNGRLVRPFEEALFSVAAPGVIAAPVETRFGFHAVRVTGILPARATSYEEARETLADEVRADLRERATDALLRELEQASPVQRNERVIGQLGQVAL